MKKIVIALVMLGLLGCVQKFEAVPTCPKCPEVIQQPVPEPVTICPPFPKPPVAAVTKIQSLHDADVDAWIGSLFKLKQQLKDCK